MIEHLEIKLVSGPMQAKNNCKTVEYNSQCDHKVALSVSYDNYDNSQKIITYSYALLCIPFLRYVISHHRKTVENQTVQVMHSMSVKIKERLVKFKHRCT